VRLCSKCTSTHPRLFDHSVPVPTPDWMPMHSAPEHATPSSFYPTFWTLASRSNKTPSNDTGAKAWCLLIQIYTRKRLPPRGKTHRMTRRVVCTRPWPAPEGACQSYGRPPGGARCSERQRVDGRVLRSFMFQFNLGCFGSETTQLYPDGCSLSLD
jgi:hypothetical protein